MNEQAKATSIELTGPAAEDALERFAAQMAKWSLATPAVKPLVLDFGLGDFEKTGLIEYWIANEIEAGYCGKYLFVFDGQTCPMHHHVQKHETFFIVQGRVRTNFDGGTREMSPGDILPVDVAKPHSFTGIGPALLLELSTPCHVDDNYFADTNIPIGGNYQKNETRSGAEPGTRMVKESNMALKAGVATTKITPTTSQFLYGYPHVPRMSTGVHDPLLAAGLCLDNGSCQLISIALDIIFISKEQTDHCRAAISDVTGVPAGNIMISATHTHSGPQTVKCIACGRDKVVPPVDPEYVELFVKNIIEAGVAAYKNLQPAQLAVTTADGTGVGGNRHDPENEPSDPEVGLLMIRSAADKSPLALQMIYSMHPTVIHEDIKLVNTDFPGYARQHIAEQYDGLSVLYHTGPAGNQSPRWFVNGQTFEESERLGRKLGAAVVKALGKLTDADFTDAVTLAAQQTFVNLPSRTFCSVAEAEKLVEEAYAEFERLKRENAGHGPIRSAECTTFGAEERLTWALAQESGKTSEVARKTNPVEVHVLRIGDTYLAAMPGECFVEYGLDIKQQAPARTFVVSCANGMLEGYIVTPDATGYEAGNAFFKPESGAMMVDAAVETIRQMQ